ncbi:hypothetical protein VP01_4981g1 [Puccinia sorghi]|uniref:Reverse transcriptase Ty1/copia-type domain-containing protein n=1 Tax=Puccinia sorghi TaxID=27349 RepID=A0A0L6UNT6_9BASI|nr:hypothetical protein VP01_4981g1 [Puccinia sorghi]
MSSTASKVMKFGKICGKNQALTCVQLGFLEPNHKPSLHLKKKARLCIQGFLQLPGVDYDETFAPTGKFSTLLILLTLAIEKELPLRQFDVKAAFLYAPLKENLYIKTPEGSKRKSPYLRLKKSLYGLKQAPANWFETLTSWLKDINFHQSTSDPCLFIHSDRHSFVFFHVDDLIVAGKVDIFEDLFLLRFPNSSAHDPDTLLGMDLHQTKDSVALSQPKLIQKGLELLGMEECKPVRTPLSPGISLIAASQEEKEAFQKLKINYRSHTGLLNFLACQTRPDLAPAVSILSSFNSNPGIKHWSQVLHCWKYLKGTMDLKLTLRPDKIDSSKAVKYYTDSTWADDLEYRLSRSGSICFWKACPVAWNSKKQKNIALSSTKAELNALSDGVQESQWITYLIEELWKEKLNPTEFNIDNQGLLEKIKNFGSNSKTKHLDIKMKWLRELKNSNQINVKLIPSEEMVADALTKPSGAESLRRLQERCFLVLFSPN